jgi:ABC-type sugar transport system ATPase subunit
MSSMLEVKDVRKAYGGTVALSAGNLEVEEGTIHGIVGPNGAGKSTLMKIIGGHIGRDGGTVTFRGEEINPTSPVAAQALGIVTVPQEISLADRLSVAANISLGVEPHWGPFVSPRKLRESGDRVLDELGLKVASGARAGSLRADEQRLLMFAQGMARQASLLILDEPTAGLNGPEANVVLGGMERLKHQGRTELFVSHRFGEVLRVCDRVTIIRDGTAVETAERSALTLEDLIRAVAGDGEASRKPSNAVPGDDATLLELRELEGGELRGVTFSAHRGEIVGIVGLAGSGVEEMLAIIGGAEQATGGSVVVDGKPVHFATPADALDAGVAYLPADRTRAGLLALPIETNVSLSRMRKVTTSGFLNRALEGARTREVLERMGLADRSRRPLSSLSGGNRQKALIGRAMFADAQLLAFADPTVGVDFRARREIQGLLRDLADGGRTVLVSSSEPEELAVMADRVIVLREGKLAETLIREQISLQSLTRAATT